MPASPFSVAPPVVDQRVVARAAVQRLAAAAEVRVSAKVEPITVSIELVPADDAIVSLPSLVACGASSVPRLSWIAVRRAGEVGGVRAGAAVVGVVAETADQRVVLGAAGQRVVAVAAVQQVVALRAGSRSGRIAEQRVAEGGPVDVLECREVSMPSPVAVPALRSTVTPCGAVV